MARHGTKVISPGGSPYKGSNVGGSYSNPEADPAAREKLVDRSVDHESHNLHAGAGQRCMICDLVIDHWSPTRRTVSGGYVHDACGQVRPAF